MTVPGGRLATLLALAREPSSTRRRELLREITDAFFAAPPAEGGAEHGLYEEVISGLAAEMEAEVKAELAERLADQRRSPRGVLRLLACEDLAIARPILSRSVALREEDLVEVALKTGDEHLKLVSERPDVTEKVSDAILSRGSDEVVGVLVGNSRAVLSRSGNEAVVERAKANPALQEAVVRRRSLPPDLLNELYFVVETRLRREIAARNAELDPAAVEAALKASRARMAARDGAVGREALDAEAAVETLRQAGKLTPGALIQLLRSGAVQAFVTGLAALADLDAATARRLYDRRDLDALAVVCSAAGFDPGLFLALAVLLSDPGAGSARAGEYETLFRAIPREAAERTLRFWRLRRLAGAEAA